MAPAFLVTAATGHQGGSTARFLIEQNAIVHALVRDISSPTSQALKKAGAILFQGTFDDVPAIKAATLGVTGIFLNPFPTPTQVEQMQNFIDVALASETVKTVVLSTAFYTGDQKVWGDDPTSGLFSYYSKKAAIEEAVRNAGFENYTILRPAWLMYNYLAPQSRYHFPELSTDSVLAHAYEPGSRMSHLDAADVEKFAAAAVLEPDKFRGHEIEMGNENLTIEETGKILSKVIGFEVPLHARTVEEILRVDAKVPSMKFQQLANVKDLSIDGKELERKYGIRLATFEEYLEGHKDILLKSFPARK